MAKRQPPRRLFKAQDRVSSYKHDRSATSLMKQVSREHLDVLKDIETVLVARHREDRGMDDRAASEALRACLAGAEPADPRVAELVAALGAVRRRRDDIADDVWRDALRVVDDSVRRHSDRSPGAKGYLTFTARYI